MTTETPARRVEYRDSDHSYWLDGKRVPSVTTILGNLAKPGLVWWSATEGAKAFQAWFEENAFPKPAEPENGRHVNIDETDVEHLYQLIRRAHNERKQKAADKGTAVHAAIDSFHTDFWTAEAPPEDTPERAAWDAFVAWWNTAGLRAISTERVVVDAQGRYAGRLDLLVEDATTPAPDVPPGLYVADTKTSKGVYAEHIYQNAMYAAAIESEMGRPVDGTKVLWLPTGATELVCIERTRDEWLEDFHAVAEAGLLTLHHHRRGIEKTLKAIKAEHGPKETDA